MKGTLVLTAKLRLYADKETSALFEELTSVYSDACNYVSNYVFDNCIPTAQNLHDALYRKIRSEFKLKAQLTQSVLKTVGARYSTIKTQFRENPYKYKDEKGKWHYIKKTLEWLQYPVSFSKPQADLVHNRDYSFVKDGISINTMKSRVVLKYKVPEHFKKFFTEGWIFGTGKLLCKKGVWYFHVPVSKEVDLMDLEDIEHLVGLDRGLRFLYTAYDETGKTKFISGEEILKIRAKFLKVRAELQARNTKSAKRALKRLSGRENRWMTDINHQLTKALVQEYGANTLYVLEDLSGAKFAENNTSNSGELSSWAFYQFEEFLTYKALAAGASVIKVSPAYTSQRCPRCGRIHKDNRDHETHLYTCDKCGYKSNDDRVGAMNIFNLGKMYLKGEENPKYVK